MRDRDLLIISIGIAIVALFALTIWYITPLMAGIVTSIVTTVAIIFWLNIKD